MNDQQPSFYDQRLSAIREAQLKAEAQEDSKVRRSLLLYVILAVFFVLIYSASITLTVIEGTSVWTALFSGVSIEKIIEDHPFLPIVCLTAIVAGFGLIRCYRHYARFASSPQYTRWSNRRDYRIAAQLTSHRLKPQEQGDQTHGNE